MNAPAPEPVARWTATVVALLSLVGLAVVLGVTVAPAVALAVLAAVAGAAAVALWRRAFDERSIVAERAVARPERSAFTPPDQP